MVKIEDKMKELVKLCQKAGVLGQNTPLSIDGRQYYASFTYRTIHDKDCPRCKGRGKIPLKPSKV